MKLLDSPGFWAGGKKKKTQTTKEKKKTEQEQALRAELHVALYS